MTSSRSRPISHNGGRPRQRSPHAAHVLCLLLLLGLGLVTPAHAEFSAAMAQAERLDRMRTLHIAHDGEVLLATGINGASADAPRNIKSVSKLVVSALVGIAIDRGVLDGADQPIAPLLRDQLPEAPDPRIEDITLSHLLSMQAGLQRTSGSHYGAWTATDNWVAAALNQPFVDEPGGRMLYSTGNSHLLSAILMRETGTPTDQLANEWLAPAGFQVASWTRDPQDIPLGGNEMAVTPQALLAFGELYRRGGRTPEGEPLLPASWIEASWKERTQSRFTGDGYGYGWFLRDFGGYTGYFGWGFGGQMLYVIPELELTVAITSSVHQPAGRTGYRDVLHDLVEDAIIPVIAARSEAE